MQVSVNINIEQLIQIIKNLSKEEQEKLMDELKKPKESTAKSGSNFQDFLLNAPTMSDDEFNQYVENRKRISQWRTN
ncbi:MAG: hypothetical protein ACLFNU_10340 [Bacteroidales bacterium]